MQHPNIEDKQARSRALRQMGMSMVFQKFALLPHRPENPVALASSASVIGTGSGQSSTTVHI
jgi:hypothetical protein